MTGALATNKLQYAQGCETTTTMTPRRPVVVMHLMRCVVRGASPIICWNRRHVAITYLVDHVGDQAFHLVRVNRITTTVHADRSLEFDKGHSGASHLWFAIGAILAVLEPTNKEDFT